MNRKEFLKNCTVAFCTAGLCCAGGAKAEAAEQPAEACDPNQLNAAKDKIDAGQLRFAKLVEEIDKTLDEPGRKRMFNGLGRQCAATFRPTLIDRYKGDLRGFLKKGLSLWMAEAVYDEAAGTIRIVDKSPSCTCPLVKVGTTPPSFCDCTLGWQEEAYSTILGRPVHAELEESILRGGKRCVFRIKVV
jgi:predicted hydrocarbon binding protein